MYNFIWQSYIYMYLILYLFAPWGPLIDEEIVLVMNVREQMRMI